MNDYMPRTDYALACYQFNEDTLRHESVLTYVPKLVHTLHAYADATLGFSANVYLGKGGGYVPTITGHVWEDHPWFQVSVVHGQCQVLKFHIDHLGQPIVTYVQHHDSGQWNDIAYATGRRYLRHYRANYGKRANPPAWFLGERVTVPDMEGCRR